MEVSGVAGPVRIPPGRQQVILAALLMEANQVVTTDFLVDAIWEDAPPNTARTQVQICVSRLRKTLAGAEVTAPIVSRSPGYVLRVDESALDALVFNDCVRGARALVTDDRPAEASALLRTGMSLWRGPCLVGLPHQALRTKALRLDEDRLNAVETCLELDLGLGRHHELVGELARLVHENPLRERLRGLLMRALYLSGRQSEALAVYRDGRDRLIDELGLEPGKELRALENAILASDTSVLQGAAAEPEPATETVTVEGGRPGVRRPHQLPADTADFTGNDDLVAAAETVLVGNQRRRAVGVVVVVGKPGVGKSTLATHIGHRVADEQFPDAQLYCDLRGVQAGADGVAEVLGRFLPALGIPGHLVPDELAGRVELYRTLLADQRVLVVLDNAMSEAQVTPLLPGSSSCGVIVTSRSRLTGVPGAHRLELDVFTAEHSLELLGRIIGADRLNREPESAAALVRTVGGLPLALRIVGARLAARPHWTLAAMVGRLVDERRRLDELAHGDLTVRASLSLTHDGLDPRSRKLFALLSVAEGATMPGWAASAVLDDRGPYPSDLLEPLIDVHLLEAAAVEPTGEFRYRYQDMIRLFAREQLAGHRADAERSAALRRLLGGWLAMAEQAHRGVYGGDFTVLHGKARRWQPPADYVRKALADPLEWLDGEHDNLCAAVRQAADNGLAELSWDLAVTLVTLFESRGHLDDWERTHRDALAATRAAGDDFGMAALLNSMGTLYINRGQPGRARALELGALAIFERAGEPRGIALCQRDLGLLDRQAGDDDSAYEHYTVALREFTKVDDAVGRAIVLTQSAPIVYRRGEQAKANAGLTEAMDIYRSVGYVGGIPHTLRRIGQFQLMSGDFDAAVATMSEALDMVRHGQDVIGEGHMLYSLGEVNAAAGRHDRAQACFRQALTLREQIMDTSGAAVVRLELAKTLRPQGAVVVARQLLEQAMETFAERGMERERLAAEAELAALF